MFEKEAEEKSLEQPFSKDHYYYGFKDGAEFGYNKANEWHYVKDGDFPTDVTEREYLVALKSEYTNDFFFETDIWCRSLHCFATNNPIRVYAWKEIVLPELKENDIKRELFPEITLPEGSAELVDKVIADAEKRLKESE